MDFNNIQKNTKRELIQMKHLKPIYQYDTQKKKDRPIHYLTDTKRDFLITLNPLVYQTKDEVKDAFSNFSLFLIVGILKECCHYCRHKFLLVIEFECHFTHEICLCRLYTFILCVKLSHKFYSLF